MKLIDWFRQKLWFWGYNHIKKSFPEKTRSVIPYNEAVKIGILFNATDPIISATIRDFGNELISDNKKVQMLGFINSTKLNKQVSNTLAISYFSRDDISFLDIPKSNILSYFVDQPFDILINLHFNSSNVLLFLGHMSNASYRIGSYTNDHSFIGSDIMINCNGKEDILDLIEQIKHYFNFIK